MPAPKSISPLILKWFAQHGRTTLPWQQNKTPYRVWVSEIMLQQTQVSTVIPYYQRFMEHFPDVMTLALADPDLVLHLWTGLGYYTRARNLHKTAKMILESYNGIFPDDIGELQLLPGIGRSTAGAICSIAFQKKATILDGNVRRVLVRLLGIKRWPGEKETLSYLWEMAEKYTPNKHVHHYTQAMMDLGATICVRGKPLCPQCPLKKHCLALEAGIAQSLPVSKPKKALPIKQTTLLIFKHPSGKLWLEKRPAKGIWGGLWSFPETGDAVTQKRAEHASLERFGQSALTIQTLAPFRHTFSHYHLDIQPVIIPLKPSRKKKLQEDHQIWYNVSQPQTIGLPAPIKKILMELLP